MQCPNCNREVPEKYKLGKKCIWCSSKAHKMDLSIKGYLKVKKRLQKLGLI